MPTVTTPVMTDATGRLIASAITAFATVPAEITISDDGDVVQELVANTTYHFTGLLTSLTITLAATTGTAIYNFDFNSGATAPSLTVPNTIIMPDNFSVKENKHYEIGVLGTYGVALSWSNS